MIGAGLTAATQIAGGLLGNSAKRKEADKQYERQKEFATQGIRWKVEDAKAAGIHPLYAMGASTHSFSPVQTGTDYDFLGKAGQEVGRAIDSTRDNEGKVTALQQGIAAQELRGKELDNKMKELELASQIAKGSGKGPGLPGPGGAKSPHWDGQGDAIKMDGPKFKIETKRDVTDPTNPPYIPGSGPSVGVMKNTTGGYSPVIPPELAESLESDFMGRWDWMIRNRLIPNLGSGQAPSIPHNRETEHVVWSVARQQWEVQQKPTKGPHAYERRMPLDPN